MANLEDKKWFVYIADHHEGPFSLNEIQAKMDSGQITSSNFVWCDGMPDWKMMAEVADFSTLVQGAGTSVTVEAPASAGPEFTVVDPIGVAHAAVQASSPAVQTPTPILAEPTAAPASAASTFSSQPLGHQPPSSSAVAADKPSGRRTFRVFLLLLLVSSGGAWFYFQGQSLPMHQITQSLGQLAGPLLQAVPALGSLISPIPRLEDVSPDDYSELKTSALATPTRFAVALSKSDTLAPFFYVSGQTADDSTLDLYVVGIPDTLLNQVGFSAKVAVTLQNRFGKSDPIRDSDGKALARGEYWVVLVAPAGSTNAEPTSTREKLSSDLKRVIPMDARIVGLKTVFLGGEKDATYTARLKEFHDRMTERANQELSELKQFQVTLLSQLTQTQAKYASLQRGKVTSVHHKVWNGFTKQWSQLMTQMIQTTQTWPAERLDKEYYYGALYRLTQDAALQVQRVHELQQSYFNGVQDKTQLDAQLGTQSAQAQALLDQLKSRLDAIEKSPATPGNLPTRDQSP